MPYPFVMIWYLFGTIHLNWLYDNDVKVNYYAQYKDSTCRLLVWLMLISILFKWFIMFTVEGCYGKYIIAAPQQQPAQAVQNNNEVQRRSSLAPPRLQPAKKEEASWKNNILSFLPKGANYYVKNPTPKEIEEYKNRSKSFTVEDKLCKICYCSDSNTLINACGHSAMCKDCAKDVAKKMGTCPLCRTKIDRILVIERINEHQVKVLEEIK